ncbi:hypothetical protein KM043_000288 [Ampulex compressa]|nr:hypothetical protein KM043_000288 [Ampulex compressa]
MYKPIIDPAKKKPRQYRSTPANKYLYTISFLGCAVVLMLAQFLGNSQGRRIYEHNKKSQDPDEMLMDLDVKENSFLFRVFKKLQRREEAEISNPIKESAEPSI